MREAQFIKIKRADFSALFVLLNVYYLKILA